LGGKYEISPLMLLQTLFFVIDLDVHDLQTADLLPEDCTLDDAVGMRGRTRTHRMREVIADRLGGSVQKLTTEFPGAIVEGSGRGIHVAIKSAKPIGPENISQIHSHVASVVGGADFELFPKAVVNGLNHCRAPLCGRAGRILASNLVEPRFTRRAQDVDCLLESSAIDLDLTIGGDVNANTTPEPVHHNTCCGGASEHLHGQAFIDTTLDLLESPIPGGRSYEAAHRIAFAFVCAGLELGAGARAFNRWIEWPGHTATHCQSASGRRELLGTFRCEMRRYLRAREEGEITAKLRHPALTDRIRMLVRGKP